MDLTIERFCTHAEMGTFSEVRFMGKLLCYMVERPWITREGENHWPAGKPFESCIPAGIYKLEEHYSKRRDLHTFALVNENLQVFHYDQGYGRYACLIHVGNWMSDVEGCLAPGRGLGYGDDKHGINRWMVTNSGTTTRVILDFIKLRNIKAVNIIWRLP